MKRPTVAQNIALSVTGLFIIMLLLLLFGVHLDLGTAQTAKPKKEALTMADIETEFIEEELYIEPELVDVGDPDNLEDMEDAPMPQGEPEQADDINDKLVVNGPNPIDNQESEPLVAVPEPSPVKTTTPSQKPQPDQKITEPKVTVKGFNAHNGKSDGKGSTANSGQGGNGSGAKGEIKAKGRKLEHYTLPNGFSISKAIQVTVTVMVKADGTVESGSAKCTGIDDRYQSLKAKIIKCSEQTKWTPQKGAVTTPATIYWTLVPGTK